MNWCRPPACSTRAQITASHIVRRTADHEVRLLSSLLTTVAPGALLAAERGEADWPHPVFSVYWPQASAQSFAPLQARPDVPRHRRRGARSPADAGHGSTHTGAVHG